MIPLLIPFLGSIIDKIFPDADAAAKAKLELLKLEQDGAFKQLEVNAKEAENSSIFVAGWRPFIGWVCGSIFAYNFLVQPLILFVLTAAGHSAMVLPTLDLGSIMPVLLGMLGLGGLRTYEKVKGVKSK